MKTPLLCLFLVYLISLTIATAQPNCDTLILYPERALSVVIDSIAENKVYCRMCADSAGNTQVIPLKMVAGIRHFGAKGSSDSSQVVDMEAIREANKAPAVPAWLFTKKANKKIQRKLERGIKVKVTYLEEDKKREPSGRLKEITNQHLTLEIRNDTLHIPKEDIIKITPKRKLGLLGGIVSGLAIGVGLGLVLLVLLLLLGALLLTWLFSFGQNANTSGVEEDANTGCSWALIALFIGFIALFFAIPKSIRAPFSDEWEVKKVIQEEPAEQATELEDAKGDEDLNTP